MKVIFVLTNSADPDEICCCCLLILFANSWDPDETRHNVWPDLDSNYGHSNSVPERIFEEKNNEKIVSRMTKIMKIYPA